MFRRTISAIVSPTVIKIDADGMIGAHELVVTVPKGRLPEKAAVGDQLEILGKIRMADPAEFAKLGLERTQGKEPLVAAESILDHAGDE